MVKTKIGSLMVPTYKKANFGRFVGLIPFFVGLCRFEKPVFAQN